MNCRNVFSRLCRQQWNSRPPFSILSFHYRTYPFSQTLPALLSRNKSSADRQATNEPPPGGPKLLVVQPRLRPDKVLQVKLSEALNLASSLGDQRDDDYFPSDSVPKPSPPPHIVVQNPTRSTSKARAATYFGQGTVDNITCHLNAVETEDNVDAVFINASLTGTQLRNLEKVWDKPVLDRVGLIIEIFHAHANTKEAKLQAELAALMYKKTRLVRERASDGRGTFGEWGESGAEVVSARGRGSGGRGFISGAGETELELQRRRIVERRNRLLNEIAEVRRTRGLQRASRKRSLVADEKGLATIAVVGYTNAGKSTLVSALSDSYMYSDDRLFATVDPKLRSITLPSGRTVLLSDTVGFISDLPTQLVEAFHATLEEVVEADLLLHVVDSSSPNLEDQRAAVLHVLKQIGVAEEKSENMIEVWNKIDLHEEEESVDLSEVPCCDDDVGSDEEDLESYDACDGMEVEGKEEAVEEEEEMDQHLVCTPVSEDHQQKDRGPTCDLPWERVSTSAVTGVGLQELLEAIDVKLEGLQNAKKNIVGRGATDRKWRPPRHPEYAEA